MYFPPANTHAHVAMMVTIIRNGQENKYLSVNTILTVGFASGRVCREDRGGATSTANHKFESFFWFFGFLVFCFKNAPRGEKIDGAVLLVTK